MFGPAKPKYQRLTTNLRLSINRLKLLEKKKTELAIKARREISEYLLAKKEDRARIRVEHIIREDYLVEAMEIVEMFCDLLLARMGMIQSSPELDPSLEEAIATILWITPRLLADVPELRIVSEQLSLKYSKPFALRCITNSDSKVNPKVVQKLSVSAPEKYMIDKYLEAIADTYNIDFYKNRPDDAKDALSKEGGLIDLGLPDIPGQNSGGNSGAGGPPPGGYNGGGGGGIGVPSADLQQPLMPQAPPEPPYNPTTTTPINSRYPANETNNTPSPIGFNYPQPNATKGPRPSMPYTAPAAGFIDQFSGPNRTSMPPAYSDELVLPDIPTDLGLPAPSTSSNSNAHEDSNKSGDNSNSDMEEMLRRFNVLKNK